MSDSTRSDRTLTWWPVASAAVIAVIVLAVILFVGGGDDRPGSKRDASGALACPSAYNPDGDRTFRVPTDAAGVDATTSLVPNAEPTHVTVCTYDATSSAVKNIELTGHRTLGSGLRTLTRQLSALPKAPAGFRREQGEGQVFLLGLTFDTGYVWVAVHAADFADNGQFVTRTSLTDEVASAYRTGVWPASR